MRRSLVMIFTSAFLIGSITIVISCKHVRSSESSTAGASSDETDTGWVREYVEPIDAQNQEVPGYNIFKKRIVMETEFTKDMCDRRDVYDMIWYKEGESESQARGLKSSQLIVFCLAG